MQHCQFKDSAGQYCTENAELHVVEGTRRAERVRFGHELDDRICGVADYEPGRYCYYHAKLMKGMLAPDKLSMTTTERAEYKENYEAYQQRYTH